VEHPREAAVDETQKQYVTEKSMQTDSGDHDKEKQKEDIQISENMNKELKKEGVLTEINEEKPYKENEVTKKERKMEDTVTKFNNSMQDMADVEGSVNVSSVSNEVCHILQNEAKKREEFLFIDVDEGQKGKINVTQEEKSKDEAGETSSSKETMKHSVRTETAAGKQEHRKTHEKEENETDGKVKKEINIKYSNDTEKGRREDYENIEQQKEPNDDETVLDLNYKAASFMMKVTPESSTQKSLEKVMERSQEKQTCTSQKTTVKLNEKHIAKNSKTPASEMILPAKKYHEGDQSRGILDMSITEKPICTVFQGRITRDTKCEENVQRSDITHSSQNRENNNIKAGNSFSTEAAISDQLKQLELKFQQSTQEKPAPLKPQPLRQQTHQKQQKQKQQTQLQEQTQNQQKEQNQMKQKQQQEEKTPAQQNEQQQQQQKTQNRHKKEEKEQAQQKQIRQTQQSLKQKIQRNQKHEEKQCTQQNQQQSMIEEQVGIHEQKLVEHKKQRQPQTNEKSQQKQQEHKTKKQLQQEIKQENEEEQWQAEQKCKQQHMQSHKQEKERVSVGQPKQENKQQNEFQSVKQPQQETTQQTQS
jgi:epidermal growth factor receptor substrate 15